MYFLKTGYEEKVGHFGPKRTLMDSLTLIQQILIFCNNQGHLKNA